MTTSILSSGHVLRRSSARTGRVFLTAATTGPARAGGVVMIVVSVIAGAKADIGNAAPGWAPPLNTALTACLFLAPICAGLTTLVVHDVRSPGWYPLLLSVRHGVTRTLVLRAASVAVWALVGWIIVAIEVAVRSGTSGWPSPADLTLPALAFVVIVSATLIGAAVAGIGPVLVTAPTLSIVLFLAQYAVSYFPGAAGRFAPLYADIFYLPYLEPRSALVAGQVLFVAGVATSVALLASRRLRLLVPVSLLCVAAGVVTIAHTGKTPVQVRAAPNNPVCSQTTTVRVCLRPANAFALAPSVAVLNEAVHALAPVVSVPHYFSEPGMSHHAELGPGIFIPPDPGSASSVYADQASLSFLPPLSCGLHGGPRSSQAIEAIDDWLRARIQPQSASPYLLQRVRPVLELSDRQQAQWLRQQTSAARNCTQ